MAENKLYNEEINLNTYIKIINKLCIDDKLRKDSLYLWTEYYNMF